MRFLDNSLLIGFHSIKPIRFFRSDLTKEFEAVKKNGFIIIIMIIISISALAIVQRNCHKMKLLLIKYIICFKHNYKNLELKKLFFLK